MGVIFGFGTEWLLGHGKIYDNIIRRSTMRRLSSCGLSLDHKKREDEAIEMKIKRRREAGLDV